MSDTPKPSSKLTEAIAKKKATSPNRRTSNTKRRPNGSDTPDLPKLKQYGGPPSNKASQQRALDIEHIAERRVLVYKLITDGLTYEQIRQHLPSEQDSKGKPFTAIAKATIHEDWKQMARAIRERHAVSAEDRLNSILERMNKRRRTLSGIAFSGKPDKEALKLLAEEDKEEARLFGLHKRKDGLVEETFMVEFMQWVFRRIMSIDKVRQDDDLKQAMGFIVDDARRKLTPAKTAEEDENG